MNAKHSWLLASAVLLLLAASCSTTATAIPLEPYGKPVRDCTLTTVQLESIFSYSANQRELRSLIVAVAKDHGFTLQDRKQGPREALPHTISFVLREKSYSRGNLQPGR